MAALDWSSSASASFTTGFSSYELFLNFRGEDTRNNFISFFKLILKDRGIDVFIDGENLWTGEAIGPACLRAIEESKISIPVFSEGYAYSKWCLLELAQIHRCHISKGQMVLPIFFYVEPSQVRNQTGSFEKAFQEHEKNFEPHIIDSWREALRVVGNLKGEVIDNNKDQAEIVELVVKRVLDELISSTQLAECKYPVGIESRVKDLLSLLNIGSDGVQFVGICGFGGIGKTTIAKAIYNRIFLNFNKHSFIPNVREQAMQCMGLASLQKRLLRDIFKIDFDISDNDSKGKKLIERKLRRKNVLLVLDDVDSKEQVNALAGELDWFGQGSRIIVTTRSEHILNVVKVDKDKIYWPQLLDRKESLQLFSLHAFSMDQPPKDFLQLSHDVVCYSEGLPLTLEVLGSRFSDISNKEVWESTLQQMYIGTTSFSNLASLCTQAEHTCPTKDNSSSWRPQLLGDTKQIGNIVQAKKEHMSYGNNNTTFVGASQLIRGNLNTNEFTTTVRVGKLFKIKARIRAAFSKFTRGNPNINVSTVTYRVGKRFRIEEIRAATNNFDASLVIGHGGFGIVYKGVIDGTLAAIKRGRPQHGQGLVEFETEIEMLLKLRHRHVVSMIGFCKEKNEMILVYEYMANGNLKSYVSRGVDLPVPLTWKQRLEICIGAACGLHYLHTCTESGIIHRDVKTSNILLDETFIAKMADFGLSITGPESDHSHVSAPIKGTSGYIDPEYIAWGKLTVKSDVFSFGQVLLEVVSGDQAVNRKWSVLGKQRERSLETFVDPRLQGNYCPKSVKKFGEIAHGCIAFDSKKRPTMEKVLRDLEYVLQLHEAWLMVLTVRSMKLGKNPTKTESGNRGLVSIPFSRPTSSPFSQPH